MALSFENLSIIRTHIGIRILERNLQNLFFSIGLNMLNKSLLSFMLVLLVEAVGALVEYLKSKLLRHMHLDSDFGQGHYA